MKIKEVGYTLGKRIRSLRKKRGESQKALAEALNKSESAVRMWELDRSEPDIETLKLLALHLEVSVGFLVNETFTKDLPSDINFISDRELDLIKSYRNSPKVRYAINKLLDVDDPTDDEIYVYRAAQSESGVHDGMVLMKRSDWERILSAEETDDPLL